MDTKDYISEEGNVLSLNEELLKSKENTFPPYKNKPNGLGIFNWFLKHVLYMSKNRWPLALKLYHFFIKYSVWMKEGGLKGKIYKTGIRLEPKTRPTSTIVMPLNVDIMSQSEKTVVPLDLIKESLKHVDYIAGMDSCLCRDANDCKEYPHDLGCLFLGEATKIVVKHELGRQFSYEEACARMDEAARVGLMGQAVWIEVEQMLWGVPNNLMNHFLEICFCCPCCCIAMRLTRNAQKEDRVRFHPSRWTAVANRDKCIGCKMCAKTENGCPMEALSFENGKVVINQNLCVGCGICKARCPKEAIQIKQTMPMRENLKEYLKTDYNLDLKLGKE